MAGNVLRSLPNHNKLERALGDLEFLLSFDIYINETSRHADLILPSPSYVDHSDYSLYFVGMMVRQYVRYVPAIFDLPEGTPYDWEVMLDLSARLRDTTAKELEEQYVRETLTAKLAVGNEYCAEVGLEQARAAIGDEPGPERLYDILLRTGRHGDAFGARPDGLTLAKLQAAEHGIDYGPMEGRLPDILATPDRLIDLAPELIVADLDRLRAKLPELDRREGLLLIGRRQLRSNNSWMHNLDVLVKGRNRCTLLVHPADAAHRGLVSGALADLTSTVGQVTAEVEISEEVMPGVVSLPHGWGHAVEGTRLTIANTRPGVSLNSILDDDATDIPSGNAVLNGIPVTVTAAAP